MENTLSSVSFNDNSPGLVINGKRSVFIAVVSLIALTFLVYVPLLSHEFQLQWDDQWVVKNDYTESGLNKENLYAILIDYFHGQYAPVNQLFYTLLYAAFGYNPFWFHLFCLAFHIANVILVFFFIRSFLTFTKSFNANSVFVIAFSTALLLGIHPFIVEAVSWVAASKIILYAFFYLVSLALYLKCIQSSGKNYLVLYLMVLLSFILSFMAKEQAVTLPVCLLLMDYILKRDLKSVKLWVEKVPLFAMALLFGVITMKSQAASGVGALSHDLKYPFYQNLIFASYSIVEYIVKCLIPIKLSFLYPFPNQIGEPVPLRFWMYPFVLLISVVSLWSFFKQRWVLFGILFFLIHIGLTIHIIPISRFAIIADRYVYIASIGIFFIVAYYFNQALNHFSNKRLIVFAGCVYVLSLGIYANLHGRVWHNSDSLKKELKETLELRNKFQQSNK